MSNPEKLSAQDAYILARLMSGLSVEGLTGSPGINLLLRTFNPRQPDDFQTLQRILRDGGVLEQILQQDPQRVSPAANPPVEAVTVPELLAEARLSPNALQASAGAASWLDAFTAWATTRSPMTPPNFLAAGGVWMLGLSMARRCSLHLHTAIYPHLYILWIAPTSTFKKTTGMAAIGDLVNAALPHLLLPEESTPEAFVGALAGSKPLNYDRLTPYEQHLDDDGRAFAAQRGILLDEASSLLGASRKDYMQGLLEMLLRLYDAPNRYTRTLRSEGKVIIRDASLCILGATTPAALVRNTSAAAWETGEFARYALLYPDGDMAYNPGSGTAEQYCPPADLVQRLRALHQALPKPPMVVPDSDEDPPRRETLSAQIDRDAYRAYAAYAKVVTYDLLRGKQAPDPRLHPNYARLHVQAVKIALTLAAMTWADDGARGTVRISLGHWARAQQIAETWRTSLHHLLAVVDKGEESGHQDKILAQLDKAEAGLSVRELSRSIHLPYKAIDATLRVLMDAGLVEESRRQHPGGGPEAKVFRVIR